MPRYRDALPQLGDALFLTDGGIETSLLFRSGFDLPEFAAFDVLKQETGRQALLEWFRQHLAIATSHATGFVLESVTWRASPDWGDKIGYSLTQLADANHAAIHLLCQLRDQWSSMQHPHVISGCLGPRGDGYDPGQLMTDQEAAEYHATQIGWFREDEVDMVTALTMTNIQEAIGIVRAADQAGLPVVVSFTVETDGRLPTGQDLAEAIDAVDLATGRRPAYYMINCAHPLHFEAILHQGGSAVERIRGLRVNASTKSHAELDDAEVLDDGNPAELGTQVQVLASRLGHLNVLGGCCGTDERHIAQIAQACAPPD